MIVCPNIEEHPWSDLPKLPDEKYLSKRAMAVVARIGRLPRGTEQGRSTVAIQVILADGRVVVGETTLRLLWNAVKVFRDVAEKEGEVL